MGHALLAQHLIPTMLETKQKDPNADLRILTVSSDLAMRPPNGGLVLDRMKSDAAGLHTVSRYGHSKFANVLFGQKLAELYPDILSIPVDPGMVNTPIWSKMPVSFLRMLFTPIVWAMAATPEDGAKNQLW
jgi:retinol dehydrogenase 12